MFSNVKAIEYDMYISNNCWFFFDNYPFNCKGKCFGVLFAKHASVATPTILSILLLIYETLGHILPVSSTPLAQSIAQRPHQKGDWWNPEWKCVQLNQHFPTNAIQDLNLHWFLVDFLTFKLYFDMNLPDVKQTGVTLNYTEVVPHSQPTAPKQNVLKIQLNNNTT